MSGDGVGGSDRSRQGAQLWWVRRLAGFVRPHSRLLAFCLACAFVVMVASAALPLAVRGAFDRAVIGDDDPLVLWLLAVAGLGAVRAVGHFLRRSRVFRLTWSVEYDVRNRIYDRLQRLDFARHDQLETGQLVSRTNADLQLLVMLLTFTPMMAGNIVLFFVSAVIMAVLSPLLAVVAAVVLPLLVVASLRMSRRLYPASWDMLQWSGEVAGVVEESITGVRVVKGFGQEQRQLHRLVATGSRLFGSRMRNVRITARYVPVLAAIPSLGQLALLAGGGYLVIQGRLTLGSFLAFQTYLVQLIWPARDLAMMVVQAQQARAAAARVFEILDAEPVVVERPGAPAGPVRGGRVELEGVRFGYRPDEPVLRGVDLVVEAGERVALVGGSGSGKSTIATLLPRFYDVDAGRVLVDGADVRSVALEPLRRRFGFVFEDSFLFSESVRANIAYGHPEATDEQVEAAARAAAAHDFIVELSDGYDTVVGERGHTLSGGQRQRIALARALLTDPDILVLDDATSSIDTQVEEEIHRTLREILPGRTTILVAHRRSTLALARRIVVLDEGRVVDTGTHEELVERCAQYRTLLTGDDDLGPEAEVAALRSPEAWPEPPLPPELAGRAFVADDELDDDLLLGLRTLPPIVDEPALDLDAQVRASGPLVLRRFLRPFLGALLVGLAIVLADAALALAGPAIVRAAVDAGITAGSTAGLARASLLFLACIAGAFAAQRRMLVHTSRTAENILLALRVRVFSHLQRLGIDFFEREMGGRIMTRATSDIEVLQQLLQQGLLGALAGLVILVGSAGVLVAMNARLAMATLVVAIPLALATKWFQTRSDVAFLAAREELAAVNATFQESLSGVRVAQAFVREERNMQEFRRATASLRDARNRAEWMGAVYVPSVELLSVVATVIVLGYGKVLFDAGSITEGALVAFVLYLNQVFGPIQQLSQVFGTYQQSRAALTKLRELLDAPVSVPAAEGAADPGRVTGEITLDEVRFSYAPGLPPALDGVSLTVPAGQTVALVGETGAGKSTVVKLVARFYDPQEGEVLVDGRPLPALDPGGYRRNLGYVPQEAFLFSGTIRDNIAFGRPDASDEEVEAAARAVGAHPFVARLPLGYRTMVTEGGRSMSAGQRQLIALARALLVDPVILLLDEATANLDLATEARVARAMGLVSRGRTTLLIAHRLQSAAKADRVLVIDHGHVVEDGAPDDLVAAGGRYARLWRTYSDDGTGPEPATAVLGPEEEPAPEKV